MRKQEGFRAVLFRMVPKLAFITLMYSLCFRAVLFRMVPKPNKLIKKRTQSFRAVLFRMVPKLKNGASLMFDGFRAVLFRMVPKQIALKCVSKKVLELCCFEWFQNRRMTGKL